MIPTRHWRNICLEIVTVLSFNSRHADFRQHIYC
ncbi:hypothetical protein Pvag_1281 [Pantoea vagans C9-1]|nr:hypothetical protein Pvag_1281 [Pantoea vagans C9-1]